MDSETLSNWIDFMVSPPAPAPCLEWSRWVDLLKTVGPTLGIFGAVLAWLFNKFLGWIVWLTERHLKRVELMTALLAEIESNSRGEENLYPGATPPNELPAGAAALIENLRADIGPYKPLAPYGPPPSGNPIYASAIASLALLPRSVVTPVVRYYSASAQLTNQLFDFRSPPYLALSQSRQREVIRNLWSITGREVETSAKLARGRLILVRARSMATAYLWTLTCITAITTLSYQPIRYLVVHRMTLYSDVAAAIKPVVEMVRSCPAPSPI